MHMRMQSCTCDMDTDGGTRHQNHDYGTHDDMPRGFRRNGPGGPWLASRSPAQGSYCSSRASGTHCSWRLRSRRTQRAHSRTGGGRVVSGCVRLAPRGHVAVCVARAAWLSPRGPSRSSPRASGSLCSSRLRCHAAASGRARPLARAHFEVLGRALEREPKQSRSTSEFSVAAGQASSIADFSCRARIAAGLSAFWMMEVGVLGCPPSTRPTAHPERILQGAAHVSGQRFSSAPSCSIFQPSRAHFLSAGSAPAAAEGVVSCASHPLRRR